MLDGARFYCGYKEEVFIVLKLCYRLVPRIVGPLVEGGGLCAQQLNVLWHNVTVSECMLVCTEGCQLSPC